MGRRLRRQRKRRDLGYAHFDERTLSRKASRPGRIKMKGKGVGKSRIQVLILHSIIVVFTTLLLSSNII